MIKKVMAALLSLLMLVTAAAAASDVDDIHAVPEAGSPLTLDGDMGLFVENTWYPILSDFAPLLAALGEPDELISAPSCVFQGEDKEFAYEGMSVFTNPLKSMDVWYEVYITGEGMLTIRGIGVGSPLEDVITAYGENYYTEGENMLTFSVSGIAGDYMSPCIIFELTEGLVSAIDIYFPTNTL